MQSAEKDVAASFSTGCKAIWNWRNGYTRIEEKTKEA